MHQVDAFYEAIKTTRRPVDALCVNAGLGVGGPFAENALSRGLQMIEVNIRGAAQLTKLVLKDMVAHDVGKILFTFSIAATMPVPLEAVYGGTRVFLSGSTMRCAMT